MYCPKCGQQQVSDEMRFCSRCGLALTGLAEWLGGAPLAVVVDGDPQLVEYVHAMRSFRVSHPAGKIFLAWIAGGRGRAAVAAHGGARSR